MLLLLETSRCQVDSSSITAIISRGVKLGGSYSSDMASIDNGLATDKDNTVYMANMFYIRALLNIREEKYYSIMTITGLCSDTRR